MAKYAKDTSVSSARSRAEIEETLMRYGATTFAYACDEKQAMVGFVMQGQQARITLPLPDKRDFAKTETGRERTAASQQTAWEQACRQLWRIMLLLIKAKLEAIELEATTFEREFLSDLVLPNSQTVSEYLLPQIIESQKDRQMPKLLPW